MKTKLFILITLLVAVANVNAVNFVCGKDLNNNGDVLDEGEQASCQTIDNEQFCSIGAQTCSTSQQTRYQCSINNEVFNNESSCKNSCNTYNWIHVVQDSSGTTTIPSNSNGESYYCYGYFCTILKNGLATGAIDTHIHRGKRYGEGTLGYSSGGNIGTGNRIWYIYHSRTTPLYNKSYKQKTQQSCTNLSKATYSCPTAGNSCLNNKGIMQCSPIKCIDIDVDKPVEVQPPALTTIDDGTRDSNGACMDQSSLFAGRNLSCAYKGLTKNCCKDKGVVFRDSTGANIGGTIVKGIAMQATWAAMKAGYAAFTEAYSFFGDVALASQHAADVAQSALSGFKINPTALAISIAIQVVTEIISCGQEDAEAAMLNGSGYCHYVGDYCSKKFAFGCVKKSKSYCCFNSKMARIIQQQGRPQIGMTFGSAESPNCSGFTPQQFQKLDFSKIDMSEYYNDIQSKADSLIKKSISDSVEKYYQQIGHGYAK